MATVTYEHVFKRFGDVVAVNDLSLEVRDGEFLVLVGPSGCGKTTALRMLAGLEEQTSGDIYIGDRRVNDVAPKDRDIAMVFQNYALYPHMTVRSNLAFGLRLARAPQEEIDRRIDEVSKVLGLETLLERRDLPAHARAAALRHGQPARARARLRAYGRRFAQGLGFFR